MPDEKFELKVLDGDDRPRLVCDTCGFINYVNPRVVVGAVCTWENQILMCRRAIEPRTGFWTIPAGYLEEKEAVIDGAKREAWEEAYADVDLDCILAVYNLPRISQVQIIYRGSLCSPKVKPGLESLDVALFEWDDIPWGEVAFPSVHWALNHFREVRDLSTFAPFANPEGQTGNELLEPDK
ncbi:MAG: NUDIX hydrolase [Alphaproteobacteria bacterium]|nr:NUDIX hydrolase [Alphaproteobacteria bacterium]